MSLVTDARLFLQRYMVGHTTTSLVNIGDCSIGEVKSPDGVTDVSLNHRELLAASKSLLREIGDQEHGIARLAGIFASHGFVTRAKTLTFDDQNRAMHDLLFWERTAGLAVARLDAKI